MKSPSSPRIEKNKEQDLESKSRSWLFIILGSIILLLIVFFVSSAVFSYLKDKQSEPVLFKYQNLTFIQNGSFFTNVGEIFFEGRRYIQYLHLRTDPRLNSVLVEGNLDLRGVSNAYLTSNLTLSRNCSGMLSELMTLPYFLSSNRFMNLTIGIADEQDALNNSLNYITCENTPGSLVISLEEAPLSKIKKEGNCIRVYFAGCTLQNVSEKFMVQSTLDSHTYDNSSFF